MRAVCWPPRFQALPTCRNHLISISLSHLCFCFCLCFHVLFPFRGLCLYLCLYLCLSRGPYLCPCLSRGLCLCPYLFLGPYLYPCPSLYPCPCLCLCLCLLRFYLYIPQTKIGGRQAHSIFS
eukprot:25134_6